MGGIRRLTFVSLSALIGMIAACSEQNAAPAPPPPPAVTVTEVVSTPINPAVEFVGQTEAVDRVDLRARVRGFLVERSFAEGDTVRQGRRLFVIEKAPYQLAVEIAVARVAEEKARLTSASKDLERARSLFKRGNVSEKAVDDALSEELQATAAVQAAEAALRQAQLDLGYTEVMAPFDGRIGRAAYSVGNLVGPDSDVLATLVKLDPIYATINVSESAYLDHKQRVDVAKREGQSVPKDVPRLKLPNGAAYPLPGRFEFVDNKVDPTTGTILVRAVFPNPDGLLLPGLFVTVSVEEAKAEPALIVPQAAVQEDQAGRFVLVVTPENLVEIRRVEMGQRLGVNWEVRKGLSEGDRVVYEGIQKVRPGSPVTPVSKPPAPPTS